MTEPIEYRRINCGLGWSPNEDFHYTKDAIVVYPHFQERFDDYLKFFTTALEKRITDILGEKGWAIYFTQISPLPERPSFIASVFLDKPEHFNTIIELCSSKIDSDFDIDYVYKGNIAKYLRDD